MTWAEAFRDVGVTLSAALAIASFWYAMLRLK